MIRVLLDENLPRRLKWSLNADAMTVPERGWNGIKNGRLLRLAASEFDVLLTMDRGIEYQQNLQGLDLCLILVSAVSNDIDDLLPLLPSINAVFADVAPGRLIRVAVQPANATDQGPERSCFAWTSAVSCASCYRLYCPWPLIGPPLYSPSFRYV